MKRFASVALAASLVALIALAGAAVLVRIDIVERRARFLAEAANVHRLISQQAARHDAILATLNAGPPAGGQADAAAALRAVFPQVVEVIGRRANEPWPAAATVSAEALALAEAQSAASP